MKKMVLINSPIYEEGGFDEEEYLPPLGLGYIATGLEESEVSVDIWDCVIESVSVKDIINKLNEAQYEFIGINVFSPNLSLVKKIVEGISYTCSLFIGGQLVKSVYDELLSWNTSNVFNIIIGEGEKIIPAIVKGNCAQKPEIEIKNKRVYRVSNESIYLPVDLDAIHLNRSLLNNPYTINHYGEKEAAIVTSRGCTFDCAFCGGARSLSRDVNIRYRSSENIKCEIVDILKRNEDIGSIRVLDDLFLRNEKSIQNAINIFSSFQGVNWRGMAHVRTFNNVSSLNELKASNCRELFIGIESGDEEVRRKINKQGSVEEIIGVAEKILEAGIDLKGYFILGFPDEKESNFEKTYNLAKKIKDISLKTRGEFRTSVFQFRPYHGTKLYNELFVQGRCGQEYTVNDDISVFKGRRQFNYSSGNYSCEPDGVLNDYIIKIQELGNNDD